MIVESRRTIFDKLTGMNMHSATITPGIIAPASFSRCYIIALVLKNPELEEDALFHALEQEGHKYKNYFGDCYMKYFQPIYGKIKWTTTVNSSTYSEQNVTCYTKTRLTTQSEIF